VVGGGGGGGVSKVCLQAYGPVLILHVVSKEIETTRSIPTPVWMGIGC